MAKKNFLMMSLEDDKIKKVANVVGNKSCKKILDYLAEKDTATESEISEKLEIPISTAHYNLQQLIDAGLVTADEYHYSKKGREINHYRLANKYIIITPKKTRGIISKLRNILPVATIAAGAGGIIHLINTYILKTPMTAEPMLMAAKTASQPEVAEAMVADAAPKAMQAAPDAVSAAASDPHLALWFVAGAAFAIVVYVILDILRKD